MSFDREKLLAKAQKLLQKGKIQEAIEEYEKVLEIDPKDVRILQKVGDLHAKAGNIEAATEYFRKVAEFYAADGFFLKAVAVYKQISKLDPGIIKIYLRLAELYNQLGLNSEAMKQYQIVMKHYEKKGMKKEYLEVVKKLADLDPENVANRLRLADLYAKEGQKAQALEEYKQIALEQKEKGNFEDLSKIYEAMLALEPADINLNRELAAAYLKIGEPKKALTRLQICFKDDARNADTLNLLAKAFWDLQQPDKAKSVYQELLNVYEEQGNADEKSRVEQKMRELFNVADEEAGAGAAVLGGDELIDVGGDLSDLDMAPAEESSPAYSHSHAEAVEEVEVSAAAPPKGEISGKLLAEVEVYLKYGLTEKAADNVLEVLRLEPANSQALTVLAQVAEQIGDRQPLIQRVEHLLGSRELQAEDLKPLRQALERLKPEEEAAPAETSQAEAALPEVKPVVSHAEEAEEGSAVFQRPPEEAEEKESPELSLEVDLPEAEGEIVLAKSSPKAKATPAAKAPPAEEVVAEVDLALNETSGIKLELPVEPEEAAPEKFSLDLQPPAAKKEEAAPEAEEEPPQKPEIELALDTASPPVSAPEKPAEKPAQVKLPAKAAAAKSPSRAAQVIDLDQELREKFKNDMEEAEFFISQELFDEALHIYRAILEKDATYEPAKVKLAELEKKHAPAGRARASATPAKPKPQQPASTIPLETRKPAAKVPANEEADFLRKEGGEEGFFDLAEALRDEIEDLEEEREPAPLQEGPTLEEVISQFKEGVQKTLKETDFQAHYDLGIAYKEMGLFDDAIAEFVLASRQPGRQRECESNIGLCYVAKGDFTRAIQIFEKMLSAPGLGTEEMLGIKYELAAAHESKGNGQRALMIFQEIAEGHPSFRGVQGRIKALMHPQEKGEAGQAEGKDKAASSKNKITYI